MLSLFYGVWARGYLIDPVDPMGKFTQNKLKGRRTP